MNNYSKIFFFAFLVLAPQLAFCEAQTITLKDGSQVKGELVSFTGGVYTIHTPALGDIKVDSSQVVNIANGSLPATATNPGSSAQSPADNGFNQKIQSAQSKLMADPQMMAQIQEMTKDPELMQLLSDPTLVQAVMSHDVQAIQANPKAQELMNNPKMRALMDELRNK